MQLTFLESILDHFKDKLTLHGRGNFAKPSKNTVLKLLAAISLKPFESDKRCLALTKEDNQGF